jgi:hypothetical protein
MEADMAPVDVVDSESESGVDVQEHERTFRTFTKGMGIFAAHVFVVLALLAAFAT